MSMHMRMYVPGCIDTVTDWSEINLQGLVFAPRPYSCSITPRSEAKAEQRFITPDFSKYELLLPEDEKRMLAEEKLGR